ncbi:MAG: TerC/Alx family metal homeostasis membrane protein [Acidobacteriota bacterium]
MLLFPFADYWVFYAAFTAGVLLLLLLDLGVFHREAHEVSMREAAVWSAVWVSLALAFNYVLFTYAEWRFAQDPRLLARPGFDAAAAARQVGLEFLTGYVVEKSLAIDNIFVFVVVFSYFAVPLKYQHRVLFYGILGALVFRAVFIALGSALLAYHWVLWLFGGLLILTGAKLLVVGGSDADPASNPLVRLVTRLMPVTREYHGQRFFVRLGGRLHATPLLLALAAIEASDIIFAIDSVPAIFALTREPLIVFTSNVCAILGLRSMYFLLAGAVQQFALLRFGLAFVLMFVGLKMIWLNDLFGGKFPITWSLGIITALVGGSIVASLAADWWRHARPALTPARVAAAIALALAAVAVPLAAFVF